MTFPDYETGEIKLRARMGIGTDEPHDMASVTKVIVDAALGDKVLYRHATDDDTLADGAESGLFVQVWPHE